MDLDPHETLKVAQETPKLAHKKPKLAHGTPKVAHKKPKVAHGTLRLVQETPRLAHERLFAPLKILFVRPEFLKNAPLNKNPPDGRSSTPSPFF